MDLEDTGELLEWSGVGCWMGQSGVGALALNTFWSLSENLSNGFSVSQIISSIF